MLLVRGPVGGCLLPRERWRLHSRALCPPDHVAVVVGASSGVLSFGLPDVGAFEGGSPLRVARGFDASARVGGLWGGVPVGAILGAEFS